METLMHHKHILLTLAFSAGLASIAWSADEPAQQTTAPSPSSAPAAQAAAAPPAAAATSAATNTAAKAKETTAAVSGKEADDEKRLLSRGYKKETRGNQTVYCRKEIKTGSHFETKVCGTAESMALAEQQARDLMQNSQNSSGAKVN
jgi:hypothetical protein